MEVAAFSDIEEEFQKRVATIVWCSAATIDRRGRPRSRILHPIWEGSTGWIATGRHSLKEKHLERNPHISLCYWTPEHKQIYAECATEWADDPAEKARIWDLYKNTPPPLGYDPAMIWRDGVEDPTFGVLKLIPWRIEISSIMDMMSGKEPQVWHA
jgi:general stress protein 26